MGGSFGGGGGPMNNFRWSSVVSTVAYSNCRLSLPLASEARLDASDTASPTAALAFPKAESIVV